MEYTVKALAELAGVTPRTLRWYDQIGLLKPLRTTEAGYRLYGPQQLDRLQDILFYRELGLDLAAIQAILDDPAFDRQAALQSHLTELKARRTRLDDLILTVQRTLDELKGGTKMTDQEKFEAFKRHVVEANEAAFGREIRQKYGDEEADRANACVLALTQEEYRAWKSLGGEIHTALDRRRAGGGGPSRAGGPADRPAPPAVAVLLLGIVHAPGPRGAGGAVRVRSPVHRLLRLGSPRLRRLSAGRRPGLHQGLKQEQGRPSPGGPAALIERNLLPAHDADGFQNLDHHHGAEGQPHDRAHQTGGQLRHLEQGLQRRDQQYRRQQQRAQDEGPQQELVVPEGPREEHRPAGLAVEAVEQAGQASGWQRPWCWPAAAPPLARPM